ncbi:RagB/SusD family nutrient uptake outer membrane protein [Pseudochryseolinea flava]|uniref:RagB/SusD family nutrient uptake outer membrane protein n=1 Tax=Pseudochryseolinea flava TaxID=2059302 RepID=A0A364Y7P0_9BACT|nr:RagB/SusD family nutrient uptake outer membrane protein [Pseudochryseolinea flava]RAW02407.1 RagB/SusD family nutrient uptake outer membrane protein [Pseudochryseolinea flava]
MRKKIFQYTLTLASVFALTACEDLLDRKPISDLTQDNAYVTAADAEAALVGAYDSFAQEYYIWDNIIFSDVISDNYYAGGDNAEIFAVEDLNIVPTNSRLFNNWSQIYNAILKANAVIAKVPSIADPKLDDGNRRTQIVGEAQFLRAYHYFQLVKMFGAVPLITKPTTSTDPAETQLSRTEVAEVYAQIVSDLEAAIASLPDTYGNVASVNKARATKGAANALLAKVYAQKPDRDYNKVLEHANAVINSPAGYELLNNFADLFDGTHYNNAESIIEVQFAGSTEANWGPQMMLPPSISGDTWRKFVTPSHDLIAAFDSEGDTQRKEATILFETVPWADEYWSPTVNGNVPFAYKWKTANGWASTNRQYLLRLADILLLKAEALNELEQTEAAREVLDEVRDRAGLAPTTAANQAQMAAAILKERRLELAQEGHRWDDLRRADLAVDVMTNLDVMNLSTGVKKVYNMTVEKQLLPIPQSERNLNKNLGQNPGYN